MRPPRLRLIASSSTSADLEDVLEGLTSTCFYLNWDRNRYRFGLTPNLNQILVSRRGAVQPKAVDDRVRQLTQKLFEKNTGEGTKYLERKYWPTRSNDVPNKPVLTLVVLGLDHPAGDKKTTDLMESIIRDCGASGRTYKSAVLFAVPDSGDAIRAAIRDLLAWEAIDDDEDTKKGLDDGQRRVLQRSLDAAQRAADEATFRAYRHVFLLDKDGKLRDSDMGQITSSAAGSIAELILRELEKKDEITAAVVSTRLVRFWPVAVVEWPIKGVRDVFYSSPQLPRLLNPDSIKRTIVDGVTRGDFGYAIKDARGQMKLEKFKESMAETEVEVSDEAFILKTADALKLMEPPRLADLTVQPEQVSIKPGGQIAFTCSARDQYGQPFPLTQITWSATGGTISQEGLFTAGEIEGLHAVHAKTGGMEAVVQVELKTKTEPQPHPSPPGKGTIRWHGTVPPQKWMNFYTKVLSRYAASPDLKLEVSFEVTVDREQVQSRKDETRSGLKELGLDDDVQ